MERKFIITENTLAATLQYLGTQPHNSVNQLIVALGQCELIKPEDKPEDKPDQKKPAAGKKS